MFLLNLISNINTRLYGAIGVLYRPYLLNLVKILDSLDNPYIGFLLMFYINPVNS